MSGRAALALAIFAGSACSRATTPFPAVVEGTSSPGAPTGDAAPLADSQELSKLARSTQNRFEAVRRNNFPRTLSWASHPCDEIVGRFCLWHVDDEHRPTPPPEREAIRESRDDLLARFDSLSDLLPGDGWIVGQRVRYLLEAGRADEALDAARACRARPAWWCLALQGYALHGAARFPAADSAFAEALAAMPDDERCHWTDVSWLFADDRDRSDYRKRDCPERSDVDRRFWWLADPLWMVPGNDRRTEHYARRVLDQLQLHAASGYGIRWGDDLTELLVRYGWPASWERAWGRPGTLGPGPIVSHQAPGARTFEPSASAVSDPTSISPGGWTLDPPRPQAEYKTAYADDFEALEHQLAFFPRGDSAIVVVAYDAGDGVPVGEGVAAALVLGRTAHEPLVISTSTSRGRRGVIVDTAATGPTVVSVEAIAAAARRASRARYGATVPSLNPAALALSDLLLFRPLDSLPATIEEVAPLALASSRIGAGQRLGAYWEISGAPPGETVDVAVSLEREGKSWLRKTFEWIGLAKDRSLRTRLAWGEEIPDRGIRPRALAIDLPDLDRGVYRLTVAVTDAGGRSVSASKTLIVP